MYPLYKRPYQADLIVSLSVFRAASGNAAKAICGMDIESPGTGVWRGVA